MAKVKSKDIKGMNSKAREEKLKDLQLELMKARVHANKQNAKTKEIKKAIARIHTFNNLERKGVATK